MRHNHIFRRLFVFDNIRLVRTYKCNKKRRGKNVRHRFFWEPALDECCLLVLNQVFMYTECNTSHDLSVLYEILRLKWYICCQCRKLILVTYLIGHHVDYFFLSIWSGWNLFESERIKSNFQNEKKWIARIVKHASSEKIKHKCYNIIRGTSWTYPSFA